MPWIYRMAMRIFLLAIPLFIYAGLRMSTAIAASSESTRFQISKKAARIAVFSVIVYLYIYPALLGIYQLTGNTRDLFIFHSHMMWQDYLFVFPSWWGIITLGEILPYFITIDIADRVSRMKIFSRFRKNPGDNPPKRRWPSYIKIAVAGFFIVYVGIRAYFDTKHVRISTTEAVVPNLPEKLDGLQLCLIGDIHMNRYTQTKDLGLLKNTLQSGDDHFYFFSGDLTSRGRKFLTPAFKLMSHPKGKIGNIACMGDHDYWTAPNLIAGKMKKNGWDFLRNRHRLFTYKGHRILVTGITYVYSNRISPYNLENLFSVAPEADLKILLVHQPREFIVKIAARYGYHVFLGGHTHGGEVVSHVFGMPYSPGQSETPYCWGHKKYKKMHVIVTNGIGRTLAALRYHAPAEITRVKLVRKKR